MFAFANPTNQKKEILFVISNKKTGKLNGEGEIKKTEKFNSLPMRRVGF